MEIRTLKDVEPIDIYLYAVVISRETGKKDSYHRLFRTDSDDWYVTDYSLITNGKQGERFDKSIGYINRMNPAEKQLGGERSDLAFVVKIENGEHTDYLSYILEDNCDGTDEGEIFNVHADNHVPTITLTYANERTIKHVQ